MKKFFALVAAALMSATSFAQISDATPSAPTLKTGNRPDQGTWGLYMGVTSNMIKDWGDDDISLRSMPLLNIKYMCTDNWELRTGVMVSKKKSFMKGEMENNDFKGKTVTSENMLTPGFAYHFGKNNILDVYTGAEILLGWKRDTAKESSDNYSKTVKHPTFNTGVGAFVGLQAFIGHLPLAIGCEYGLSNTFDFGDVTKVSIENDGNKNDYVTHGDFDGQFDSMKNRKGAWGSQFRLTVSYYFK